MANTFSQIHIQIVFAVKGRQNLLAAAWRADVFRYMSGIITQKGQKAIIVNGVADHVHLLVGLRPAVSVAELVRDVKNNSSNYINRLGLVRGRFAWQEGYGAFSYGRSQVERVYNYILRQEEHHHRRSFRDEYTDLLRKFQVDYDDEKYLFDWID